MFIFRDGKTVILTAVFNALHAFIARKLSFFPPMLSKNIYICIKEKNNGNFKIQN